MPPPSSLIAPEPSTPETCAEHRHLEPPDVAKLQARMATPKAAAAVADVFRLLGDPTRIKLLDALGLGERCVCDLAALVGISESAISHQLRVLRAARLVRVRRSGRLAFYALDDHHVTGLLHDARRHVEEQS